MNKRLVMLEQMTSSGKADSFAWYALALEYRKEGQSTEALSTFSTLRDKDPNYLPMYLMAGQTAHEAGQAETARTWLTAGIELARQRGDGKTLGELESELATLP
jgi:predicted Zn-dependent protease